MSFKKLVLLFFLFSLTACGVKGPPTHRAGTEVPSFISPYLQDQTKPASTKDTEKEESKESSKEEK